MRKTHSPTQFFSKFLASFGLLLAAACLFNSCQKDMKKSNAESNTEKSQKISPIAPNAAEDCLPGYHWDPILRQCVQNDITVTYAGVSITYEPSTGMLNFNSINNVNTVINQLDADNDTYNNNYDNQYPNYTVTQLDSMDVINNFDEFKKFKDFENLFPGYSSKRKQIVNTENTWLANNFSGTDPDDTDLTFDDAENTIFNSNYSFKIGASVYQFRTDGFYKDGVLQAGTESNKIMSPAGPTCKSNKKRNAFAEYENGTRRFKLKVAINSWLIRSGVKGKVVHYKKNNGSWKRKRAEMAVGCGGRIYVGNCAFDNQFIDRNPSPNGFKKRKQLKVARHYGATVWRTFSNEISSSFDTPNLSISGVLALTF